jgi:hypothetical protein
MVEWFFCEETNQWPLAQQTMFACLYAPTQLIVAYVSRTRFIAGLFFVFLG